MACAHRRPFAIFPGAMRVTDLLFFRSRGGELGEVDEGDPFGLDGDDFTHILGTEVGEDADGDDQTAKPSWGYRVVGTFARLPDLVERPMCGAWEAVREVIVFPGASQRTAGAGVAGQLEASTAGLSEHAASAVARALRVDRCLAALSAQTSDEHVQRWPERVEGLNAMGRGTPAATSEGPPSAWPILVGHERGPTLRCQAPPARDHLRATNEGPPPTTQAGTVFSPGRRIGLC